MTKILMFACIAGAFEFQAACGIEAGGTGKGGSLPESSDASPGDGCDDASSGEVTDGSVDHTVDDRTSEIRDTDIGDASATGDATDASAGDATDAGDVSAGNMIIRAIAATDYLDSIADDTYPIAMKSQETKMVTRTSRLASLEGTFDGSSPLVMRVISSYPGGQNDMPVFIDDAFQVNAFGIGYAEVTYTILAGPGSHSFKIWTAQQTRAQNYLGTWVDELEGVDLKVSKDQAARRVLVSLGDSIAGGGDASNPSRFGINALLRSDYPGRVVDIGYGMLRMADKTAAAWAADVVRAAGLSGATQIDVVNLAGTNDYGMPSQSAVAYGNELGAWADSVIAALPAARIVIVEILPRSPESANGLGDTLAAFRAQQASVVAARASSCRLMTASSIGLTPPDGSDYITDGLHLSDPGHAKVKARIKSFIGY